MWILNNEQKSDEGIKEGEKGPRRDEEDLAKESVISLPWIPNNWVSIKISSQTRKCRDYIEDL